MEMIRALLVVNGAMNMELSERHLLMKLQVLLVCCMGILVDSKQQGCILAKSVRREMIWQQTSTHVTLLIDAIEDTQRNISEDDTNTTQ